MFIIRPHFPIPCSSRFYAVQQLIQQNWRFHHVHQLSNDYSARHGRFRRGGAGGTKIKLSSKKNVNSLVVEIYYFQ